METFTMSKCAECSANFENEPLILQQADRQLSFCSLECVIAHSVNRVRRRIALQNRRMQRYLDKQVDSGSVQPHRAAKFRIN